MSFSIKKMMQKANQDHRERMGYIKVYAKLYTAIIRDMVRNKVNIIHANIGWRSLDLHVSGDYEMLLRSMRILRSYGLNAEKRPAEGEAIYYASWESKFNEDDFDLVVPTEYLNARIFLNFSSTQCERVKVGTRLEEVPVYETRCK